MRYFPLFTALALSFLPVTAGLTADKPSVPLYRVQMVATDSAPLSGIEKQSFSTGFYVWGKPTAIGLSGDKIYIKSRGGGNLPSPRQTGFYPAPVLQLGSNLQKQKLLVGSVELVSKDVANKTVKRNISDFNTGGSGSYTNQTFYRSTSVPPSSFRKVVEISGKATNSNPQIIPLSR